MQASSKYFFGSWIFRHLTVNTQSAAVVIMSRFLSVNLCTSAFFYFNSATSQDVVQSSQITFDDTNIIVPWRNFTPFLGAAALCSTKIDNFIRQPQKWKSTKNEDNLKTLGYPNGEDDPKMNTNPKMKTIPKAKTTGKLKPLKK